MRKIEIELIRSEKSRLEGIRINTVTIAPRGYLRFCWFTQEKRFQMETNCSPDLENYLCIAKITDLPQL